MSLATDQIPNSEPQSTNAEDGKTILPKPIAHTL
jgi:hypothetical protein